MADSQQSNETAAWRALAAHHQTIKDVHLRQLFSDDAGRGERLTAKGAGLYLDYSKNRISDETIRLLLQLAHERGVTQRRDAMFRGDMINVTERRAVLHVALRAPKDAPIMVDGQDVVPDVHAVLDQMADFAGRVRCGAWLGHTGKHIRNVINIASAVRISGPRWRIARCVRSATGR
jgi:glucose-6-phosphate isomerase